MSHDLGTKLKESNQRFQYKDKQKTSENHISNVQHSKPKTSQIWDRKVDHYIAASSPFYQETDT